MARLGSLAGPVPEIVGQVLIRAIVELIFEISNAYEYLTGKHLVARQLFIPTVFAIPIHFALLVWAILSFSTFAMVVVAALLITRAIAIGWDIHDRRIDHPGQAAPPAEH